MKPTAMLVALAGAVAWLAACGQLAGHAVVTPSGLAVFAGAALTCALAALVVAAAPLARTVTVTPLLGRATALRARSRRTAFLRQRDPDAAGRIRPRAPSAGPAAA